VSAATFRLRVEAAFGAFALSVELESSAQRLGLFGPSGAGKTSLLETVAGWRAPRAGRIEVGGRALFDSAQGVALAPEQRGLGYVPQDGLLFPHRDVRANLAAGARRARGRARSGAGGTRASFERVVEVLELGALLERYPATLSGGERQRVALGRALCSSPDALLLDEPLASLDHALRRRILPYLVRVGEEFALPILYVSHDPTELAVLCDEVARLEGGRVLGLGRPADLFASAWRDQGLPEAPRNVLRGIVGVCREDVARIALTEEIGIDVSATGLAPGARVVLTLAADEILVALRKPEGLSARNILAAVATELTAGPAGVVLRARLEPSGPALDVLLSRASTAALGLAPGKELFLVLKSNAVHVLSALPGV
jgi:molybdate transport system ATP-binding protein